jgi:hypothetical protein
MKGFLVREHTPIRQNLRLMIRLALVILLAGLVQGCAVNPLDLITPKPGIEVNAQVAKNADMQKSALSVNQGAVKQTADAISNDTSYEAATVNQITNNLTPFQLVMLCLLAGWALPDPIRCYAGTKHVVMDIFKGLIVYPISAVAQFILKLFKHGN